ncbi:MAG: hypothetical protein KGD65_08225 [Candidatus Lokiarchaeota archaeon]|nr:hypothetical protein [Candidatus Lokiarchaeota archaeon]
MRQEVLDITGVNTKLIIDEFCYTFQPSGKFEIDNDNIHIYVIEKYFFRTKTDVATIVLFEEKNQNHLVVHIGIAGGTDLFGFSLGAHNSMLKRIKRYFREKNLI